MKHTTFTVLLVGIVCIGGCAGNGSTAQKNASTNQSMGKTSTMKEPAEQLSMLEEKLLHAENTELTFHVSSSGAFVTDLKGSLKLGKGNVLKLQATGMFGEQDVVLSLESDGTTMIGGNGSQKIETATPTALRESVVIGLTRMGILHNLARLTAGVPPDHADGDVREWVQAVNVRTVDAANPNDNGLGFDILVSGQESGSVELFCSQKTSLPKQRSQRVHFPGGEMHVTETYLWKS